MPEAKEAEKRIRTEGGQAVARRERDDRVAPQGDLAPGPPRAFMHRMTDEMDHWFDRMSREFWFPRRSWFQRGLPGLNEEHEFWSPRVESVQKGDGFIVRAELPGLKKDDVEVQLSDDMLTIRGERRHEREEERDGYYRSEREYGEFHRAIPLPEGVISASAQATFHDGVLEVTMQAAPAETRGRRLEIKDSSQSENKK